MGSKHDVKDRIPRKKNGANGILNFYWTKGGSKHPNYDKYQEVNSGSASHPRRFRRPKDDTITDWWQQVGHVGKGKSEVHTGNLTKSTTRADQWVFSPLNDIPAMFWRIPDLAPTEADATIYTGVNIKLYQASNPDGFLNGAWSVGDTIDSLGISVVNGVIAGLEGIVFSTTPLVFDPFSAIGWSPVGGAVNWLSSSSFQSVGMDNTINIVQQHVGVPTPGAVFIAGIAGLTALRRRRHD